MSKEEAIKKVEEFINSKEFSWEVIYLVDNAPIENATSWVFKNLWEPAESIRGNQIREDWNTPRIIVDKVSGIVNELSRDEFTELSKKFE
jgi:hypothetical protein